LEGSELLLQTKVTSIHNSKTRTPSNDTHFDKSLEQAEKNLKTLQSEKQDAKKVIEKLEKSLLELNETKQKNLKQLEKKKRRNYPITRNLLSQSRSRNEDKK